MNKKLLLVIPVVLALAVAGCGKKKVKTEADVGERGVVTGTTGENGSLGGVPVGGPVDRATQRRVHFEFDSASIDEVNRAIVTAHAAYLVDHPGIPVTLEGHADERGTREYNLALGERRAKAVGQMMQALGVAADRISTTSYGEERPLALGHNESAWQLNRRVEIIYADQ